MKILLATESYWPNLDGGALFERRLAHGLAGLGHNISIWTPGKSWRTYKESDPPTTIYREKSWVFFVNPKYRISYWPFWSARCHIRRLKPDVVHIHNAGFMGLSALYWCKRYHIPVVATNHFMPENALLNLKVIDRPFFYNLIWRYLVWFHNHCNFVTSPTPTAIKLLIDHGLTAPHQAITNGIDMAVFKPGIDPKKVIQQYKLPTNVPLLLYLGRVDGEKRVDLIIAAMPLILQQHQAHLVIAGAGIALASCQKQAAELGLTEHITFTGFLDEADKPLLYNAATVFVMASPAELQSIVMLEAMATALPIVSVDVAALKELCHDGKNGYLFKRDDYRQMAQKITAILASHQLQASFGAESKHIVAQHHTTDLTFKTYESVYNTVVERTL